MIRSAFATHVTAGSGTTLQNLTYSWDQLGNLTERKDYSNNLDETYQYAELSRLTKVGLLTNGSPSGTENSYSYDLLGNMLTKSDVGSYNFPPAGSAHPRGLASINHVGGGSTTMTYDGNGDVVTEQGQIGRTITWTLFGQPASISYAGKTISFSYDADHNRVSQTSPEGTTIYLPDGEGFTPAGQSVPTWHTYFSADGERVGEDAGQVGGSYQHHYFLNDPQGSIGMVTDDTFNPSAGGPIPQNQGYDTFGQPRNANGAPDPTWGANAITKRGYINQEHLTDVRLIDLNARTYDPQLGVFLSPDPVVADQDDSQAWNSYAYAGNDPMSNTDQSGLNFNYTKPPCADKVECIIVTRTPTPPKFDDSPKGDQYAQLAPAIAVTAIVAGPAAPELGLLAVGFGFLTTPTAKNDTCATPGNCMAGGDEQPPSNDEQPESAGTPEQKPPPGDGKTPVPLSANQMNKAAQRGQAPRGIGRTEIGKGPGEQQHTHIEGKGAVNITGSWKHGGGTLTKEQAEWLKPGV